MMRYMKTAIIQFGMFGMEVYVCVCMRVCGACMWCVCVCGSLVGGSGCDVACCQTLRSSFRTVPGSVV